MKNNKGVTLVELIISIALISIVIVFLFNLLSEVRYVNNNTNFNRKNQQKRAIILKTIEEDFLNRGLVGLADKTFDDGYEDDEFAIVLSYKDGTTGTLEISGEFLSYTNDDGYEKWYLEKQSSNTYYNTTCVTYSNSLGNESIDTGEYFFIKFRIPIVVKKGSPNNMDDLEFTYIGLKSEVDKDNFAPTDHLGNYDINTCNN